MYPEAAPLNLETVVAEMEKTDGSISGKSGSVHRRSFGRMLVIALALTACTALTPEQPAHTAMAFKTMFGQRATQGEKTGLNPDNSSEAVAKRVSRSATPHLSVDDSHRYRHIFALQRRQKWADADAEIAKLGNSLLLGHVLADRYLSANYVTSWQEASDWLKAYPDHPDTDAIYRLARARLPEGESLPMREAIPGSDNADISDENTPDRWTTALPRRSGKSGQVAAQVVRDVRALLAKRKAGQALARLAADDARQSLNDTEYDALQTEIAAQAYYAGRLLPALRLAEASALRSGSKVRQSYWIAGLAAFRLNRSDQAMQHFARLAADSSISPWTRSASSFWAARAAKRSGHDEKAELWLEQASRYPTTFYGILALHRLNRTDSLLWQMPEMDSRNRAELQRDMATARALALADIGENDAVEAELTAFTAKHPTALDKASLAEAMIALAVQQDMPKLALKLASVSSQQGGVHLLSAAYPVPRWQPKAGYKVDRALMLALIRQESRFDRNARSGMGATGLMQLMPATARAMDKKGILGGDVIAGLKNPAVNLSLGQEYVMHLLEMPGINQDLFRMATAYNAGPGNLAKWDRMIDEEGDPLAFIESIPAGETRAFIERVMANYWLYQMRFGQTPETLAMISDGRPPIYTPPTRLAMQ